MGILIPTTERKPEYKQPVAPANPHHGLTWLDTSGAEYKTKIFVITDTVPAGKWIILTL